jgi:hypothetical protein
MQTLVEWSVAIAVVAEPYSVPAHPRWFGGEGDSVAIYWSSDSDGPHCNLLHKGLGYVVVRVQFLVCHRTRPQVADRGTPSRYGGYRITGVDQNQ